MWWRLYLGLTNTQSDCLTCNNPSSEVDVDDAGGEGGQDHSQRGKEATNHHHRTAAKLVNQHTAERTWMTVKHMVSVMRYYY